MRTMVRLLIPLIALGAGGTALSLMGCSGSSKPAAPSTVRGRVTFQGSPVAGSMVIFTPDRDRGATGKPMRCETGIDGVFELHADGAVAISPAWYRVAIAPPANDPYAGSGNFLFPSKLRRPDTSTLLREVEPGKEHFFEFAVEVPASPVN